MSRTLRGDAEAIWRAAVAAVRPEELLRTALADEPLVALLAQAPRILVVGGGKAGAAMAVAVEASLLGWLDRIEGVINVPEPSAYPVAASPRHPVKIRLHAARPTGSNQPTVAGVEGTRQILDLLAGAGPNDVALCLLSGGGSALLPAPVEGVSLEDKQAVTTLLHACGATINEMNCVRKHLSRSKGGRLAQVFRGKALSSLIISDVVGDALDVIASGPTAADPTTFADALAVLDRFELTGRVPAAVLRHLEAGQAGRVPETLKELPANVTNRIIGNNALALAAARTEAERLGYRVVNLGSYLEGETRHVAAVHADLVRAVRHQGVPAATPACLLSGGETTVTLVEDHGKGGRNQEFVLAAARKLGGDGLRNVVVLSGGTDGEDGPTDAAGAVADEATWTAAAEKGLDAGVILARNDAYPFFAATGGLLKTGLTETNVMDVRVLLVA